MKIIYSIAIGITLCSLSLYGVVNFVYQQGDYLGHTSMGQLLLNNPDMNYPVFLTSDQGQGYQVALRVDEPGIQQSAQVGSNSKSLIECQKPLGHPIACTSGCTRLASSPPDWGTTQCKAPTVNASYSGQVGQVDFLNENGTQDMSNFVFLDSLINNTNARYDMAITTAPLYQAQINPTDGSIESAPNTIAGALAGNSNSSGSNFSFINNIYSLAAQVTPSLQTLPLTLPQQNQSQQTGSSAPPPYQIQFPSVEVQTNYDRRFTLFGKDGNNPAANQLSTKRHMALPQLSLSVDNTGNQTIILYPRVPLNTCQPVIFIGRDNTTNIYYALTYLIKHTIEDGTVCCEDTATNAVCPQDTLYCPQAQQTAGGCALVSANEDGNILSGTPARIRVTIDPVGTNPDWGYASSIEVLQGLWWPGQPDFDEAPSPAPFNGGQRTVVPLSKTSSYVPQKKVVPRK